MNRPSISLVQSLFLACLTISCAAGAAETTAAHGAAAKADPAKGEALYSNGDAGRGIIACVTCHGAAGNSTIVQNPKLAGQHEVYLSKQLANFKGPDRAQPVMTTFAKALNDSDIKNVAAYLARQQIKSGAAKNKDTIDFGKKIYRGGIAEKNIPACASCHGPTGAGIPDQYPRIGAQHQDYTIAQLTNFRTGSRKNSAQMLTIAKRMSDDEMKAVADYIAGMR
jgi:cytochrome c553